MASQSVLHILRTIKERGTVSRTELQQATNLSWGTITNTTRELLQRKMIREVGAMQTKAGRKPVVLEINAAAHALVGLELAPGRLRCVAVSLAGKLLWQGAATPAAEAGAERVLEQAAELASEAMQSPEAAGRTCLGVGLGAPGAVDAAAGMLRAAPHLAGWQEVAARGFLQARLGRMVQVENAASCAALAERWFGSAGGAPNVACIMLGKGLSMGMLIDGMVYRGADGMAGELGHMTVDPAGPACACGNQGCLELYCMPGLETAEALLAGAQRGEKEALEAWAKMGRYLGIGVANVINLLNPNVVVLCGPLAAGYGHFRGPMEQEIAKRAWRHAGRQVVVSRLGERAVAMGACGVVLQGLLAASGEEAATGRELELAAK